MSSAKVAIPRCLTLAQRKAFFLPPEPPAWCIEMEKWPYNTPEWKQWLADVRAGKHPQLPFVRRASMLLKRRLLGNRRLSRRPLSPLYRPS